MTTTPPSSISLPDLKVDTGLLEKLAKAENHPLTRGFLKGVEKEGLRVDNTGGLSTKRHPTTLGSPLTHSQITTDFSEALMEFITPPTHLNQHALEDLQHLHRFTYKHLGTETLWPASMPCRLPNDDDIPVALYGNSNIAKMKTIYREGLGLRYGRTMQTVAGLHYNFSLPRAFWAYLHQHELSPQSLDDYTTTKYFHLIRNFRRYYWLLIYLFGASPVVDKSFIHQRAHNLKNLAPDTFGLPYATSLRMGDLGYQSSAQSALFICYDTLSSYIKTLNSAIHTPYPAYQDLNNERHQQLNTSLLQIENEFYSPIRPKRTAHKGETALTALCKRGVEYLEVRCLDLDPYEPVGVSHQTLRFIDAFLLYCLLLPSPECNMDEFARTAENQSRTVNNGRKPGLKLVGLSGEPILLSHWAEHILEDMRPIIELLKKTSGDTNYCDAYNTALDKVHKPELTPSGKIMAATQSGISHIELCHQLANKHKAFFNSEALSAARLKRYEDISEESLQLLQQEEEKAQVPFEEFLQAYYKQYGDCTEELNLP